jgi:predicted tellurium resistance membrane protein TerC
MEHLLTIDTIISFFILVILEIVLGIDNVIFVSLIVNRLSADKQKPARRAWMINGIIMRSVLLFGLTWLLGQKGKPLFHILGKGFDIASLVMLAGGIFLIYKSVHEIHQKLEGEDVQGINRKKDSLSLSQAIIQILIIDLVFSFDSIITAGGTAQYVEVMIGAVVVAMFVMFLFSPAISRFIHKHPTFKMLALSFLVMIGLSLIIEGWDAEKLHDLHLKNYIYFGMAFSFAVELLNTVVRKRQDRRLVNLNEPHLDDKFEIQESDEAK